MVLKYIGLFDIEQKLAEEAIQKVVDMDRTNVCLKNVFTKVVMINSLYSTFLNINEPNNKDNTNVLKQYKQTLSVGQVARYIVEVARTKELDNLIENGNEDAVNLICKVSGEKYKSIYSFATKYCNWHNQESFSIVDKYVKGFLYYIKENSGGKSYCDLEIFKKKIRDYHEFCLLYDSFKHKFRLDKFAVKEIDKFLWRYGKNMIFVMNNLYS